MGNKLKTVLFALIAMTFVCIGTAYIVKQRNSLQLNAIQFKSLSSDYQELNLKYDDINQRLIEANKDKKHNQKKIQQLTEEKDKADAEKKRLEAELQAKKEAKTKLAKASEAVVNRVTGTSTASASSGDVKSIIIAAANRYGIDPNYALHIAKCESTYNPSSVNYNYWVDAKGVEWSSEGGKYYPSGLFQHVSIYWPARAAKYGYAGASVFDPVANANVTMGMWRDGSKGLWECN